MAHLLPIFLHFDIIYLTFATDFWQKVAGLPGFFHHLFGNSKESTGQLRSAFGCSITTGSAAFETGAVEKPWEKILQTKHKGFFWLPTLFPPSGSFWCHFFLLFFGAVFFPWRVENWIGGSSPFRVRLSKSYRHPAKFTILLMVQKSG